MRRGRGRRRNREEGRGRRSSELHCLPPRMMSFSLPTSIITPSPDQPAVALCFHLSSDQRCVSISFLLLLAGQLSSPLCHLHQYSCGPQKQTMNSPPLHSLCLSTQFQSLFCWFCFRVVREMVLEVQTWMERVK